jgi:hypothetical protein
MIIVSRCPQPYCVVIIILECKFIAITGYRITVFLLFLIEMVLGCSGKSGSVYTKVYYAGII